jgi:hypothetical protein
VADSSTPTSNTTERVLEAAARVLAPLIRLFIAKGVTYQMADELMKRVYVQVAQSKFVENDEATGTRLSLLTGLNRKEIRRLTEAESSQSKPPMISYASAVHAVWRTQRRWRNKDGSPKVLPRRSEGAEPSFDELVRTVTSDHRPSAVFEELLRLHYIEVDADENITLSEMRYVDANEFEGKLLAATDHIEDHFNAAVTNTLGERPKFLERTVFSDELSCESAEKIHLFAREEWDRVQDKLVDTAIQLEKEDAANSAPRKTRIRLGIYFYSEDTSGGK